MSNDSCCGGHQHPDEKTEQKLLELEHSLQEKPAADLPSPVASQNILKVENTAAPTMKDDLYYFSGIALVAFALLTLFQHIRVGTGLLQLFGFAGQGFGLLMLPLLAGIGLIVYNPKNKLGYFIVAFTFAIIFYTVLASLIMSFPPMSLLALIFTLAPLAVGGAFIVKGLGGPKGIEYKMRQQGLIKRRIEESTNKAN